MIVEKIGTLPYMMRLVNRVEKGYLVLMYHSVGNSAKYNYSLSSRKFEEHLKTLSKNVNLKSLDSMVRGISGDREPKNLQVGVSFDDGYKDNFEKAVPLLKKYDVPATFFVTANFIETGECSRLGGGNSLDGMSWDELREISSEDLFEIGNHGHEHRKFSQLSRTELSQEIDKSQSMIESNLGVRPDKISCPNGLYDSRSIDSLKKDFNSVFTSDRVLNKSNSSQFKIGRIALTRNSTKRL